MPKISGETPTHERASIITNFRQTKGGDCVLFSTVGDQSIDLPEADVVIQVALYALPLSLPYPYPCLYRDRCIYP